jgi:N-methylhydantoinase B
MALDPVFLEILANRLRGVVNEMQYTINRTAFSVFVKETQDFIGGMTTTAGEVCAFPDNAPPMLLGCRLSAAIGRVKEYEPGDIVFANDPHTTSGLMTQVNDLHLWKPFFWEGKLLFFLWDFLHVTDVGGRVPGSIAIANDEIFQEGVRIPPSKLYRRGVLSDDLVQIFLANSRTPELNWGDLKALIAALNIGEARVTETVRKYGADLVVQGIDELMAQGEARARAVIASLPDGDYAATDYLEVKAGGDRPIKIALSAQVRKDELMLDFTGTDPQVPIAVNLVTEGHCHGDISYGLINFLRTADPSIPLNGGILRPIKAHIPQGTLLNPVGRPAIGGRMATVIRVLDVVYAALSKARDDLLPAASGDPTLIFLAVPEGPDGPGTVSLLQPLGGGYGARPNADGIDGTDSTTAWLRNAPTEALELDLPIVVRRYHLNDHIGAGKQRGGRGTVFEFETLRDGCRVLARIRTRLMFRPWGRDGGEPGGKSGVWLNPGTPEETYFNVVDVLPLKKGDVLRFVTSCGAGYGDPLLRDPALVLADVSAGLVDAKAAKREYGVVVGDEAATAALRRGMGRREYDRISYGLERVLYELGVSPMAGDALAAYAELPSWRQRMIDERMRADPALSRNADPAAALEKWCKTLTG